MYSSLGAVHRKEKVKAEYKHFRVPNCDIIKETNFTLMLNIVTKIETEWILSLGRDLSDREMA